MIREWRVPKIYCGACMEQWDSEIIWSTDEYVVTRCKLCGAEFVGNWVHRNSDGLLSRRNNPLTSSPT